MVLYDKKGVERFFSAEEVKEILTDYREFYIRRQAFSEKPEVHAFPLLHDLDKVRTIPESLRFSLRDSFKLKDEDLNKLEEECKKYISPELLKLR